MKKAMEIVLVEDNRFHAMLFQQAVRERYPDFVITTHSTAKSFLQTLKTSGEDLIALDFNLPDMDGLQLLSLIRAEKPDIPVILITGAGSEQTAVEAMKSGATDYIAKNGDYGSTIPRVIKQACQKQQLILRNRRLETIARETEKLEMITTTASTLNHEVNNPLMAILGNIELLLDDPAVSDETVMRKLKIIETAARRIKEITHQIEHLMTPTVRQTPAGPMLKLKDLNRHGHRAKKFLDSVSSDKSN
jgi:DNA-binding response OmpR family regulator